MYLNTFYYSLSASRSVLSLDFHLFFIFFNQSCISQQVCVEETHQLLSFQISQYIWKLIWAIEKTKQVYR